MLRRIKHVRLTDYPIAATLDRVTDRTCDLRIYDLSQGDPRLVRIKTLPECTNQGARQAFQHWIDRYYPKK